MKPIQLLGLWLVLASCLLLAGSLAFQDLRPQEVAAEGLVPIPASWKVTPDSQTGVLLVGGEGSSESDATERTTMQRSSAAVEARLVLHSGPRASESSTRTSLVGRVTEAGGRGLLARIEFGPGLNQGRVLCSSQEGDFAASDLYPGFSLITATAPGYPKCTRELFLAPYRQTRLDLGFVSAEAVRGRVCDEAGNPIDGAEVSVDGGSSLTDGLGGFHLLRHVSGSSTLIVRAASHALERRILEGSDHDPLEIRLQPACTLELALGSLPGGGEVAVVYLLPRGDQRVAGRPPRPATPWYLSSPLRCAPGGSVRVEGLPAGEVEVLAFHPRARGVPAHVRLAPDRISSISLTMIPLPIVEGRITRAGLPLVGAAVELRSLAPVTEILSREGGLGELPRLQPLSWLPSATQEGTARAGGGFTLGWWEGRTSARYLTITDRDGSAWTQAIDGDGPLSIEWETVWSRSN